MLQFCEDFDFGVKMLEVRRRRLEVPSALSFKSI